MIPEVPFPHDLASRLAGFLDLDDRVGKEIVADRFGPAAGGNRFLASLLVPDDHQDVAVGQPRDIVVRQLFLVEEPEIPYQLSLPGELLDAAAGARAAAE